MQTTHDKMKLMIAMVVFGTIGLVRRYIPFSSALLALARGVIGSVFLLILHFVRGEKFNRAALRQNGVRLCLSGILIGANWILLFEAYRYTSISAATMAYYMAPVFVILAAPLFLREPLSLRSGLCAAVALAGMVLVSGVLESGLTGITGILLGLGAAVLYATVVLLNKSITGVSPNERTIFQLSAASLALLPYVFLTEDLRTLQITAPAVVLLLVAGIVHTGMAYALYFGSIRTLPAQTVALFSYIDPIVAVVLSVAVLHEPLSPLAMLGVVLVLGAMFVCERKPAQKAATPQ